jgi:raffinose/stachyose/melibiose transport system substrate-binding protein
MKRSLALWAATALLALGLAAPAVADTTELTLLIDNNTNAAGIKAATDAFTAKTGIKVTFDLRPGGPDGENIVKTRLASGDMDDMSFFNTGSLYMTLNPAKNFVDLSAEPYIPNVIDSFKAVASVAGKVYAAPSGSIMGGGWYYNKAIYAKLGLKVPKTWAELMANLAKIKAANITPVIASYKDSWTSQLIILADYYNVQVKNPDFAADYTAHKAGYANTPAALSGFERLQDIFKKGYINKDASSTTYDMGLKMLISGQGANYPMLTFATASLAGLDPVKINDIGFFAQPGDSAATNGLTIWMPGGISIYKGSKNIDAAKKFLAFYESPEGHAVQIAGLKPDGPFAVKGIALPTDLYPATKDMLPYVDGGKTAPALEFLSPIKGPNLPQICVQTGLGLKSPLENAQEYDKDVAKQAKQLGLAGW